MADPDAGAGWLYLDIAHYSRLQQTLGRRPNPGQWGHQERLAFGKMLQNALESANQVPGDDKTKVRIVPAMAQELLELSKQWRKREAWKPTRISAMIALMADDQDYTEVGVFQRFKEETGHGPAKADPEPEPES